MNRFVFPEGYCWLRSNGAVVAVVSTNGVIDQSLLTKVLKRAMLLGGCSERSSQEGSAENKLGGREQQLELDLYEEYCNNVADD